MSDKKIGFEMTQDFSKALEGDRDCTLDIWKEIANGNWNKQNKLWCQEVASRLVDVDTTYAPNARAKAIQKAVGLGGKTNPNRYIDALLPLMDFDKYDQAGNVIPEKEIEKKREIVKLILKEKPGLADREMEKLIGERINKLNKTKNKKSPSQND